MSENTPPIHIDYSPTIGELAAALAKAQLVTKSAPKDHTAEVQMKSGGKYTYAYADLAGVWEAGRVPLGSNGLAVVQIPNLSPAGVLEMTTLLLHSSGEFIRGHLSNFPVPDKTPQGVGTAITYCRRYSLGAMVGIVSEEDDDGGNGGKPKSRPQRDLASASGSRPEASNGAPAHLPKFGKGSGEAIQGATMEALEFHLGAARKSLANPEKKQYHAKDSALIGAIEAELARQRGAAPVPPADDHAAKVAAAGAGKPPPDVYEEAAKLLKAADSMARVSAVLRRAFDSGGLTADQRKALDIVADKRLADLKAAPEPGANG